MLLSKNLTLDQILKENTVPKPNAQVANPDHTQAFSRVKLLFSTNQATAGSIKEIDEVNAATANIAKNKIPISQPPVIEPNAIGKVSKISPGPELGCRLLAKTIGKIAIPANKATTVSAPAIRKAVLAMDMSLDK